MEFNFKETHIIITGGAGALGTDLVELLLFNGANCSVPCYDNKELASFSFSDHSNVFTKAGIDLTDEEQAQAFYKSAVEEQGPLWGSVHIAGGFGMGKIEDTPKEVFMKQMNMNMVTCYNCARTAIHHFRKKDKVSGRMVNIASRPGLEPRQGKGMTAYTVSKAAVAALTESLAAEVVEEDILINAVAPSTIDTPANRDAMPDANFDTWPKPSEIASQIVYLISKENSITRGAIIPVYGKS